MTTKVRMDAEDYQHEGGRESICSDTGGDLPGVNTDLFLLLTFKRKTEKLEAKSCFGKFEINLMVKNKKTNI